MATSDNTFPLFNRAEARYLDTNGNGRLDGNEIVELAASALRHEVLSARLNPNTVSEAAIRDSENLSLSEARQRFLHERADIDFYFPCGTEAPSDAQLAGYVNLAHETARQIRAESGHVSFADKIYAAMALADEDMQFKGKFAVSTAEALAGSPPPICPARKPQVQSH